jgi:hypothetical protein
MIGGDALAFLDFAQLTDGALGELYGLRLYFYVAHCCLFLV